MRNLVRTVKLVALLLTMAAGALAQDTPPREQQSTPDAGASGADDPIPTMLPHFETDRLWLSGQANIVTQWHGRFPSPYAGPHSLSAEGQDASSRVLTLFTGLRLTPTTEFLCDVQETGGHGLGEALGVAGFMNLDVVRNPSLSKAPYIARLMWHQIIPLTKKMGANSRSAFSGFSELPVRRLEIRFGKLSMADFFDLNSYGTDTNLQFMNWTVDNNGAYDYAADTRGFTFAAMVEYHERWWSVRFAEALMPKVANGVHLDADLSRARAENIEAELHGRIVRREEGIVRLLAYVNHANMGSYRQAVADFDSGLTPEPDITLHPLMTRVKYGFGANFEQALNGWLGLFGRWGWDEGQLESYAYTEVDSTVELGAAASGKVWGRKFDRAGIAFVTNGIAKDHQRYLSLGGLGFLLGDGRLTYEREKIFEAYYTAHLWRGLYPALGIQHVNNPGYNRDRGPVLVPTARLHVEF
jgi:high affinity Mn2+ porin